jgi:hypothetical protein
MKAEFKAGELVLSATLPAERDMMSHFFGTGFVHLRTKASEKGKKDIVRLIPSAMKWNPTINVGENECCRQKKEP